MQKINRVSRDSNFTAITDNVGCNKYFEMKTLRKNNKKAGGSQPKKSGSMGDITYDNPDGEGNHVNLVHAFCLFHEGYKKTTHELYDSL